MSFLGGPECSTGANPLAQFQKQTSADTSLQRDRLASRSARLQQGFRTQQAAPHDAAAFQDFATQGPAQFADPHMISSVEQHRRNMEFLDRSRPGGGSGGGWAGEFAGGMQAGPHFSPEEFAAQQSQRNSPGFSSHEFSQFQQQQRTQSPNFQQSAAARPPMYGTSFGGYGGFPSSMMYQSPMQQQPMHQEYQGKGKARIQELSDTDWEKQFEELSTEDKSADQLDAEAQDAIEKELNGLDKEMLENDMHLGDEYDQWKDFDGLSHDFDGLRTHDFNDLSRGPELGNYLFEENNVFKNMPNAFEEGMKIMNEGGNLSLAALAFEAAVRQNSEFAEAWVALGQAQAQNEKEAPAIRALEHALKLDPDNLDALMGLSVSYTNEGYDSLAYRTLERWVGVKYPQLGVPPRGLIQEEEEMGFTDRHVLHEKVTNLFLEAAQMNPEGGNVDVDVQVGLGVLFYGSEEYDKAVDCFTAALNSAQHGSMKREGEEHLLWNRLGATLANSGRSEEAIDAYSRALELRPNFVRARYNLGVSCINLGVLEQAAGHLLGALSMHRVMEIEGRQKAAELLRDGNGNDVDDKVVENLLQQNQSTNLYDTLRRVFTQLNRRDLAEMVGPDMNLDAMRSQFDF